MLAITYKKITKIKVAEWGTPKKYLKKRKEGRLKRERKRDKLTKT
jgi:hypothetical protein